MTISIWRYSHLALAVSSFVFIFIAAVTGIILAFQPISDQLQPYKADGFNDLSLAQTIAVFKKKYPEVITLEVDKNDFVTASVFTEDGESLDGYFNPVTAAFLGKKAETSSFFQWTTNLHRSLFLKSTGRFFVGLCSFLLFLIAVTGSILIIKRQRSFKKFFSRIVNDNFAQYWHVVLGRLSLIPILIITLTGVYLSLEKFDLLPKSDKPDPFDFELLTEETPKDFKDMAFFKNTRLSEVTAVEFPFSDDVEDYFTVKLKDRSLILNQFSGEIVQSEDYPMVQLLSTLSLNLHTGKGSILWSIILAIASLNILFFIYSGFAMTLKRRAARLKNKFKKNNSKFIILVGSENGSTIPFANALQNQLIAQGQSVYITELNNYKKFKKAEHIVVMTSTYGEGEAPTNASKFLKRLKKIRQNNNYSFSVVGFGSLSYPDFCKFAFDIDKAFLKENAFQLVPPFTVNDKSFESFEQWSKVWAAKVDLEISMPQEKLTSPLKNLKSFQVVSKTNVENNSDDTFIITLKPKQKLSFVSGDLLAVYPNNDYRERLYSIGKINGYIQLSVKYYENGLGSNYLYNLNPGDLCRAKLLENVRFHFPKKAKKVIMIGNGTGIAPFIGMLEHGSRKTKIDAYFGIRTRASFELYHAQLEDFINRKKLHTLNIAYSQEDNRVYVQQLLERDAEHISRALETKAVIMICGSLSMYRDVMETLSKIVLEKNNKTLSAYKNQIKSDCY